MLVGGMPWPTTPAIANSPIQYLGAQVVAASSGSPVAYTIDSLTGGDAGVSSALVAGDMLVAFFCANTSQAPNTDTTKDGYFNDLTHRFFAKQNHGVASGDTVNSRMGILRRVMTQNGPATGTLRTLYDNYGAMIFMGFRGAHPRMAATPRRASFINGAAPDPLDITVADDDCVIIAAGVQGYQTTRAPFPALPGLTDVVQTDGGFSLTNFSAAVGLKRNFGPAGTYDPPAWTGVGTSGTDSAVTVTAALKPSLPGDDPNYPYTLFLLSGGATDNAADIADLGPYNVEIVHVGNAVTDTDITLQGGANTVIQDGSGDAIRIPTTPGSVGVDHHSIFNLFDADFTFDIRVRPAANVTTNRFFFSKRGVSADQVFQFDHTGTQLRFVIWNTAGASTVIQGNLSLSANVEYHLRACRSGGTIRIFGGPASGDIPMIAKGTFSGSARVNFQDIWIGDWAAQNASFNGRWAEARLLRKALNTSDSSFTPPTSPFGRR